VPPQQPAAQPEPATGKAKDFIEQILGKQDEPVVLFALEWCEFSWSVRKLFQKYDIPYRSIDLDSVEYQKGNWGGDIRAALRERISIPTIPQIFVGGEHIGGATETFDAFNEGRFQSLLEKHGIAIRPEEGTDAYSFMPNWLHPR
jgi:cysteine synthase A